MLVDYFFRESVLQPIPIPMAISDGILTQPPNPVQEDLTGCRISTSIIMQEDQSTVVVYNRDEKEPQQVVIDSLPYVDAVHEDYEQYALSLIEEEMKNMKPPKLKPLPPLKFKSDVLGNDYETLSKHPDRKFELSNRSQEPSEQTIEAWRKAVQDSRAEYEAERQRSVVLEIEKSEASVYQWKQYGTMLENLQKESSAHVDAGKAAVDKLNAERQQHQEKVGHTLHLLNSQWQGAMQKRFQLQVATRDLERQVESMKQSTEANGHD